MMNYHSPEMPLTFGSGGVSVTGYANGTVMLTVEDAVTLMFHISSDTARSLAAEMVNAADVADRRAA